VTCGSITAVGSDCRGVAVFPARASPCIDLPFAVSGQP
jgi:hypothetical protein